MNNNKNLWISVGIVVLVVIALIFWAKRSNNPVQEGDTTPTEDVSAGSSDAPTGSGAATLLSYNEAIVKYKDFRIQFDEACTANPFSVDYKNGANVMLDNRASVPRTIKIGPNTYSVKKYGFKIVKIYSATIPMAYSVNCDAHPNVGTIRLRK